MQHQLLGGQRYQGVRTRIPRCGRAEDYWYERSEGARIRCHRPRDQVRHILALGGCKDREQQGRRRLPSIARRRDDAERAFAYPAAASFVAERGAPAAAADYLSGGTPTIRDRACSHYEQNSRSVVERVVHRDQAVGVDDYFLGQLLFVQRGVQRAPLLLATGSGDAAVENARKHRTRLRDFRQRMGHQIGDHVSGARHLPGRYGRLGPVHRGEDFPLRGADQNARLRSAAVDADYDFTHSSDLRQTVPGV